MPLAQLEDRLPSRNVIAPVAIQKPEPAEAMLNEVLSQSVQRIEVHAWRRRNRAGEVEVMIRVPEPQQRRKEDLRVQLPSNTTDDFAE